MVGPGVKSPRWVVDDLGESSGEEGVFGMRRILGRRVASAVAVISTLALAVPAVTGTAATAGDHPGDGHDGRVTRRSRHRARDPVGVRRRSERRLRRGRGLGRDVDHDRLRLEPHPVGRSRLVPLERRDRPCGAQRACARTEDHRGRRVRARLGAALRLPAG